MTEHGGIARVEVVSPTLKRVVFLDGRDLWVRAPEAPAVGPECLECREPFKSEDGAYRKCERCRICKRCGTRSSRHTHARCPKRGRPVINRHQPVRACGHPRTPENTKLASASLPGGRCVPCAQAQSKRWEARKRKLVTGRRMAEGLRPTVTFATAPSFCSLANCGAPIVQPRPGKGRPKQYCCEAHERAAYVARRTIARKARQGAA